MKACPRSTTLAIRWVFGPRIGRSRVFSRPWSHFDPVGLVLAGVMPGGRNQLLNHVGQRRRPGLTVIAVSFFESVMRDNSKDHAVAVVYFNDTLTAEPYTTLLDSTPFRGSGGFETGLAALLNHRHGGLLDQPEEEVLTRHVEARFAVKLRSKMTVALSRSS